MGYIFLLLFFFIFSSYIYTAYIYHNLENIPLHKDELHGVILKVVNVELVTTIFVTVSDSECSGLVEPESEEDYFVDKDSSGRFITRFHVPK